MLLRLLILLSFLLVGCLPSKDSQFQNGDIIFHTSRSNQSKVIQEATNSPWSHMGILYNEGGKWYVYEAVQPVKSTPIQKWIERGIEGEYVVKRLKNADKILTVDALKKMKKVGESFRGKPYDTKFQWSDEKLYCSEIVWKIYKRALNIELGELQDSSDPEVQALMNSALMKKRYAGKGPASKEVGISPRAIFECGKLKTVFDNR